MTSRKGLAKYLNQVHRYFANVQEISEYRPRFGIPMPTICFKNVRTDKARIVTDHIWIKPSQMEQSEAFPTNLRVGDIISFQAIVTDYYKGDRHRIRDFTVACVKSIEIISSSECESCK